MSLLSVEQAQLLRLLSNFFGNDLVIPQMSISAVFSGYSSVQAKLKALNDSNRPRWSETEKCMFTIVDQEANPCLIVELFADDGEVIDLYQLHKQEALEELCQLADIRYALIGVHELSQILDPSSSVNLLSCLTDKVLGADLLPAGF